METIIEEENLNYANDWNFLIEKCDNEVNKDIFIAFDSNLKSNDDDFNIFVENINGVDKANDEKIEENVIREKITTQEIIEK